MLMPISAWSGHARIGMGMAVERGPFLVDGEPHPLAPKPASRTPHLPLHLPCTTRHRRSLSAAATACAKHYPTHRPEQRHRGPARQRLRQIGRASCRERVYVLV